MHRVIAALSSAWENWNRFWFDGERTFGLGLFRFFFGLNLLIMYGLRQTNLSVYFGDQGPVARTDAFEIIDPFFRPPFELYSLISSTPYIWHSIFLISILFLMLGVFGRLAAVVALVLHLAFLQRNFAIVYGADIVASFWLFYLVLGENDRNFSLRAWWRARRGDARAPSALSSALSQVSLRLVQIQLCVIYGYTGMEKLKGAPWWDGTAVWAVFGNSQLMIADLSFLKSMPVLVGVMTHSALLWEVYFPALIWLKPLRKWILLFGVFLHTGIGIGMGLFFFSGAMVAAYFVFVDGAALRRHLSRLPQAFLGPSETSVEADRERGLGLNSTP